MKRAHLLAVILAAASLNAQTTFYGGGSSGGGGGSGTVTSVAATVPAELSVAGSPVTTSGTLAFTWANQLTSKVFAAPCGSTGTPTFRVLCAADIPALDPTKITGTAVITSDSRLTNARTPTAHASTHASVGSDPVTLAQSQVTNLTADLAGKQATGDYITALTGDVTASGPGSAAATLATVNSNVGSFTSANITVDAKGRITAAASGSGASAPFADTTSIVEGSADGTKELRFEVDGMPTGVNVATPPSAAAFTIAALDVAQTYTTKRIVKGAGSAGTSMLEVTDTANRVGFRVNENGTVVINSDVSTGTNPLSVQYNGTGVFTAAFNGINSLMTHSFGGGNLTIDTAGALVSARDATFRHLLGAGTSPTVAGSCGTSPTIAGKDSFMRVTTGTGSPTSCTVTFGTAYTNAPACTANASTTTTPLNIATTTTTVTVSSATLTAGEVLHVQCGSF